MIVERIERDGYTDIQIRNEGAVPWAAHRVTCSDFDIDEATGQRQPPTVFISLLVAGSGITPELTRRLAREYDYVADIAERLQAEKRAAYSA